MVTHVDSCMQKGSGQRTVLLWTILIAKIVRFVATLKIEGDAEKHGVRTV